MRPTFPQPRATLITFACTLLLAISTTAFADWPEGGLPVASGPAVQRLQQLVPDGAGGAYVLWSNGSGQPGGMQRITRDGNVAPGWPANGVETSPFLLMQAAADGEGGIHLLRTGPQWTIGYSSYGRTLYSWHYGADGQLAPNCPAEGFEVWSEQYPMMDDYGLQSLGVDAAYPDGSGGAIFVLQWSRNNGYGGSHRLHHVSASGAVTTLEFAPNPFWNSHTAMTLHGAGGVDFVSTSGESPNIVSAYTFSPAGGWGAPNVLATLTEPNASVQVTRLTPGTDLLFSWYERFPQTTLLRTNLTFAPVNGWTSPAAPGDYTPVRSDEQGGVFAYALGTTGFRIHRLDVSSSPPLSMWPEDLARPNVDNGPYSIVPDGSGGYFQLQLTYAYPSPEVLRVFHFGPNGVNVASWPVAGRVISSDLNTTRYDGLWPIVAERTESHAVFLAWTQSPTSSSDVYVQRLVDDSPVPTTVTGTHAEVFADRVVIDWRLALPGNSLVVEREAPSGTWRALGSPLPSDGASWRFEDLDVRAGEVLTYRLRDEGRVLAGSEISVRVPLAARFALRGFTTNPTALDATVEFTLPDAQAARLELLDLAGRVLARLDVGGLGAGTHRIALGEGLALPPGLVFARLLRGADVRTARAALIR